jgi:hypothetical protein
MHAVIAAQRELIGISLVQLVMQADEFLIEEALSRL